ncbi:hypothetical protein PSP6_340004 [Paraburkholderia tropica]|nr:hypothetical protein PSP6_340004 [Paraburkholderia tropica]
MKKVRSSYPFRTARSMRTQGRNRLARPAVQTMRAKWKLRCTRCPAGIWTPAPEPEERTHKNSASKTFRKLPAPVLPGSGAKGLSQPHCGMPGIPVKHPCFVSGH